MQKKVFPQYKVLFASSLYMHTALSIRIYKSDKENQQSLKHTGGLLTDSNYWTFNGERRSISVLFTTTHTIPPILSVI